MLDLTRAPRLSRWIVLLAAIVVAQPEWGLAMPMPGDGPPTAMDVSSNTGDATMRIPIPLPPGTGGFVPELALTYSSSGGDGPFGVGWSLEFGEIRRSIRFGIPSFNDSTDRFELNGQLLVVNPADSNSTQTRYHTSTETFVRIYHITSGGQDIWEVTRPDGTKLRYGLQSDANIPQVIRRDGTGPIFRWLLTEMVDSFGNTVKFQHHIQDGEAYPQVAYYTYRNGVAVGKVRQAVFGYVPRPDPSLTFMGGVRRNLIFRLDWIEVRTGSEVFRRIQMKYAGQAGAGKTYRTGRSRLASAQVFGVGGTAALPPQTFEYRDAGDDPALQGSGAHWTTRSFSVPPAVADPNQEQPGTRVAEVNGDGFPDLLVARRTTQGVVTRKIYLGNGNGWSSTPDPAWSAALTGVSGTTAKIRVQGVTVLASPKPCQSPTSPEVVPVTEGVLFSDATRINIETRSLRSPTAGQLMDFTPEAPWMAVDVTGDGLDDLVQSTHVGETVLQYSCSGASIPPVYIPGATRADVWVNTGFSWVRDAALSSTLPPLSMLNLNGNIVGLNLQPRFTDLDGDGRRDLIVMGFTVVNGGGKRIYTARAFKNTVSGWVPVPTLNPPVSHVLMVNFDEPISEPILYLPISVEFVDLNRDSMTDVLQTQTPVSGTSQCPLFIDIEQACASGVWLNTGTQWCDGSDGAACAGAKARFLPPIDLRSSLTVFGIPVDSASNGASFIDLNGDGYLDLLQTTAASQGKSWIHMPNAPAGSVWVQDNQFSPPPQSANANITLVDADADGATDLVNLSSGITSTAGRIRFGDRLGKLQNGRGGTIEYAYESAAKQQSGLFNLYVAGQSPGAEGVLNFTTGPIVTSRTMSGLDVDPVTETYLYGQPRFHMGERMSLGFGGTRSTIGFNGRDRIYEQRQGVAGRSRMESVFQLCGERLRTTNAYEILAGNDPAVGLGSIATARVGRLIGSTTTKLYGSYCNGSQQTTGSAVLISYEYDPKNGDPHRGFNFVTRTTTSRRTGTVVETRRLRAPDTTRWIAGLPERVLVTNSAGSEIAKMEMVYGNEGRPTQVTAYEGLRGNLTSAVARTTTMSYDVFGNLRSTTNPAGTTKAFCFDGDADFPGGASCSSPTTEQSHSVIVGLRDALGEVTTLRPDPVSGSIVETLRGGDREKRELDAFGRVKRELFQPEGQGDIVLSEADYFHLNGESGAPQEHVVSRSRLQIAGTESLRTASYLDGFGREVRRVEEGPRQNGQNRYFGTSTQRSIGTLQVTSTLPASCGADAHCLGLAGGTQPRKVVFSDTLGRPVVVTTPTGVSKLDYRSVTRAHPDVGNQLFDAVLEMDPRGYLTQRIFDGKQLIWVEECGNAAIGNPGSADLTNLQCETSGTNAATTFYRYEPTGELREAYDALAPSLTDPNRASLRFVYDSLGRVIRIHDINKTAETVATYDSAGRVAQRTNARGQTVTLGYDALDRPTTTSYPMGAGVTQEYSINYDPRTRLESQIRQKNITSGGTSTIFTQNFDYDLLGRPIRNRLQYGSSATLITETDFDLAGRTTRIRYPDLNTEVGYEYEGGYLRRVCELGGTSSCTTTGAIPYLKNIDYDAIGREVGTTGFAPADNAYTPALMTFTYSPSTYQLERLKVSNTYESSGAETLDLSYERDAMGNITSTTDHSVVYNGSTDVLLSATYTYDARNRIASWIRGGQTKYFTYNLVGNLTGKQVATFGATNQTYDSVRRHQVVGINGLVYQYDADGNLISRGTPQGTQSLTYDPLNRMTTAGSTSFAYDADGLRVAGGGGNGLRIFVGDLFEWEPATGKAKARIFALRRQVAAKTIGAASLRTGYEIRGIPLERIVPLALGALVAAGVILLLVIFMQWGLPTGLRLRPVYGSVVLGLSVLLVCPPHAWAGFASPPGQGTYRRWVWQDPLGTSVYVTDEVGLAVHLRAFEPFGGIAAERSSEPTERTFAGHEFEEAAGLYYMNARWYDPVAGRFLSRDPAVRDMAAPGSLNGYSYVENNPINATDPTGMFSCDSTGSLETCTVVGERPPTILDVRDLLEGNPLDMLSEEFTNKALLGALDSLSSLPWIGLASLFEVFLNVQSPEGSSPVDPAEERILQGSEVQSFDVQPGRAIPTVEQFTLRNLSDAPVEVLAEQVEFLAPGMMLIVPPESVSVARAPVRLLLAPGELRATRFTFLGAPRPVDPPGSVPAQVRRAPLGTVNFRLLGPEGGPVRVSRVSAGSI